MSAVVKFVGNAISKTVEAVGSVVEKVAEVIVDTVKYVAENPEVIVIAIAAPQVLRYSRLLLALFLHHKVVA
jgi:hypothetical protein